MYTTLLTFEPTQRRRSVEMTWKTVVGSRDMTMIGRGSSGTTSIMAILEGLLYGNEVCR